MRDEPDPPYTIQELLDEILRVLEERQTRHYREDDAQAIWQLRQAKALLAGRTRLL